jgi:hypothetical protein
MRQFRVVVFLFLLLSTHHLQAAPIHFDVKGTIIASANHGASPVVNGASVEGWYELDWGKAQFGTLWQSGAIYTGILTYKFTIGNNLTLQGSHRNIEYHSTTVNISPNAEHMEFQDLYPDFFNIGSFLPIEDLFFYIGKKNGVHTASFEYYSVPDFDHDDNVYRGWCDLTEIPIPEPSTLVIFMLGIAAIFLMRVKRTQ